MPICLTGSCLAKFVARHVLLLIDSLPYNVRTCIMQQWLLLLLLLLLLVRLLCAAN
jgi:hypothetical protein